MRDEKKNEKRAELCEWLREKKGWSQMKCAEYVGVHHSTWARWERIGAKIQSPEAKEKLMKMASRTSRYEEFLKAYGPAFQGKAAYDYKAMITKEAMDVAKKKSKRDAEWRRPLDVREEERERIRNEERIRIYKSLAEKSKKPESLLGLILNKIFRK